jgi:Amt family ammonium transporter
MIGRTARRHPLQRLRPGHLPDLRPLGLGLGGWLQNTNGTSSSTSAERSSGPPDRPSCTPSAAIALIGAIALGPRLGRTFKRDGAGPCRPTTSPGAIGVITVRLVRVQPGLHASAMDWEGIGRVWPTRRSRRVPAGFASSSSIRRRRSGTSVSRSTGYSAVSSPSRSCYWVSPMGAVIIGAVGRRRAAHRRSARAPSHR